MAQAARARRYYPTNGSAAYDVRAAAPQRKNPPRTSRPGVRALPGGRTDAERNRALSPLAISVFKGAMAIACVLAVVCGARVWLSVSTVQALQGIETLESSIAEARSAGNDLEIQHSVLASPTRIQKKAAKLGMVQPKTVTHITVSLPAHVVFDEAGEISLAQTIESVASAPDRD